MPFPENPAAGSIAMVSDGPTDTLLPVARYSSRINVIRFVSMCSVVWDHCLLNLDHKTFQNYNYQIIQSILLQTGRMGTVVFFLISGFLIRDKISRFTLPGYLRYRLFTLIIPWLIFVLLLMVFQLFDILTYDQILHGNIYYTASLAFNLVKGSIFHAAYWFIPVVLLSSMVLIACKRYIDKSGFGLLLGLIFIFYCINLYQGWIPANHTESFLGYIFFLWLGIQIKRHINAVKYALDKFPWVLLLSFLVFMFFLACREAINLTGVHSADPYASLRFSNGALSVLLFFTFLKSNRFGFVNRFNPKKNIYGVYLVHTLLISELVPFINRFIATRGLYLDLPKLILIQTLFFVVIFTLAYALVNLIRQSSIGFIIGEKR